MKNQMKKCLICGKIFEVRGKAYNKVTCGKIKCRKENSLLNKMYWIGRNPDYYKEYSQIVLESSINKKLKVSNKPKKKDAIKNWKALNHEKWKEYMRNYMRELRASEKKKKSV